MSDTGLTAPPATCYGPLRIASLYWPTSSAIGSSRRFYWNITGHPAHPCICGTLKRLLPYACCLGTDKDCRPRCELLSPFAALPHAASLSPDGLPRSRPLFVPSFSCTSPSFPAFPRQLAFHAHASLSLRGPLTVTNKLLGWAQRVGRRLN